MNLCSLFSKLFVIQFLLLATACAKGPTKEEIRRFESHASSVTIIRDQWGVPHIYGKSDADAVFGAMYAQCEDNFERVEVNYIRMFGRMGEVYGKQNLYEDLKMRLLYDTLLAKADYINSPAWMKKLCNAFADGVNYFLYKNPSVKPLLFTRFEPWYALMFTDGGITHSRIGGITEKDIEKFYSEQDESTSSTPASENHLKPPIEGSNAFAIAPSRADNGHALLYINPHTPFYYRTEMHMVSEEGLNAYGAVTWGQFFVFQGFNENCGWAHTASAADAVDVYEEKIVEKDKTLYYEYDRQLRPVTSSQIEIGYVDEGKLKKRNFTGHKTHHGPVLGGENGKWLTIKETNRSLHGLMQSWLRTKANNLVTFTKAMQLKGNNANNTMYADKDGNIAYWHGNFIPIRDTQYNWTQPVDGSTAATEWKGVHAIEDLVHFINPKNGWLQNCNSTPYSAAGKNKTIGRSYPGYMAPETENFRSLHAIDLLSQEQKLTLNKLIEVGYSRYLSAFDTLLPPLIKTYNDLPQNDPLKRLLKQPILLLSSWDKKSAIESIATTLATEWAYRLIYTQPPPAENWEDEIQLLSLYARKVPSTIRLSILRDVIIILQQEYGTWQVAWGEMNRYQRSSDKLETKFDDSQTSIPVPLASAIFGSLPSYEVNRLDTKRRYGVSGNSFVVAVEFGKKVKAKSIITGGQSFDPKSNNFLNQAEMYAVGKFKEVSFYKEDVLRNKQRMYHPGK